MRYDVILDFQLKSMEVGTEGLSHFLDKFFSVAILVTGDFVGIVDTQGKVLSHEAFLDCLDDRFLEGLAEISQLFVAVKFGTVLEA